MWMGSHEARTIGIATIPLLMLSDSVRVTLCECEHEQLWFFGELLLSRCRRIESAFADYIKRDGVQKCRALIIVDIVVDSKTRCWQLLMMMKISIQFVSATMSLLHWASERANNMNSLGRWLSRWFFLCGEHGAAPAAVATAKTRQCLLVYRTFSIWLIVNLNKKKKSKRSVWFVSVCCYLYTKYVWYVWF